jgi:hypothetical protein
LARILHVSPETAAVAALGCWLRITGNDVA